MNHTPRIELAGFGIDLAANAVKLTFLNIAVASQKSCEKKSF
jgi:hypothetical protein